MLYTTKDKICQLLMLDIRTWNNNNLLELNNELKVFLKEYKIGGISLFSENISSIPQVINLINDIQATNNKSLFIAIDQEGGIVTRLKFATDMPGNMILGNINNENLTFACAKAIGEELNILGINLNFAPVCDINSNYKNPIIGIRSFGEDKKLVSKMSIAFQNGLKSQSIISCAKHFPGHGDTETDTHLGLTYVNKTYDEFKKLELYPFQELIKNKIPTIMISHIIAKNLDKTKIKTKNGDFLETPSSLSKKIITDLLKNKMGFKGLIITDAFDMKSISDYFSKEQIIKMAINAGVNQILMPFYISSNEDILKAIKIIDNLVLEYENNINFKNEVNLLFEEVIKFKKNNNIIKDNQIIKDAKYNIDYAKKIIKNNFNIQLEKRLSMEGIKWLKKDNINLKNKINSIGIFDNDERRLNLSKKIINFYYPKSTVNFYNFESYDKENILKEDFILIQTNNLNSKNKYLDNLINTIEKNNTLFVIMMMSKPYDYLYFKNVKNLLAIYGSVSRKTSNNSSHTMDVNHITGIEEVFKHLN